LETLRGVFSYEMGGSQNRPLGSLEMSRGSASGQLFRLQ